MENKVYANQQAYYDAITASTNAGQSGPFIDFMLNEIYKTLNPWLTDKQLQEATERMTEHMSSQLGMKIIELERIIEYKHIFSTHNYHFFT